VAVRDPLRPSHWGNRAARAGGVRPPGRGPRRRYGGGAAATPRDEGIHDDARAQPTAAGHDAPEGPHRPRRPPPVPPRLLGAVPGAPVAAVPARPDRHGRRRRVRPPDRRPAAPGRRRLRPHHRRRGDPRRLPRHGRVRDAHVRGGRLLRLVPDPHAPPSQHPPQPLPPGPVRARQRDELHARPALRRAHGRGRGARHVPHADHAPAHRASRRVRQPRAEPRLELPGHHPVRRLRDDRAPPRAAAHPGDLEPHAPAPRADADHRRRARTPPGSASSSRATSTGTRRCTARRGTSATPSTSSPRT
jgi:hypothetical protein